MERDMKPTHRVTLTKFINPSQLGRPVEWLPGLSIVTDKAGSQVREQLIAEGAVAVALQEVIDQQIRLTNPP